MLDFRVNTFLTLCETGSYTKTAQRLHITQPAVTQHIKYLERYYGTVLFSYKARQLRLTPAGEKLAALFRTARADNDRILRLMRQSEPQKRQLSFGATLTIGEFTMPPILAAYTAKHPDLLLSMTVGNTASLLSQLRSGALAFVLVEGHFNKSDYAAHLLSREEFICICSARNKLASAFVPLEELRRERILLREAGSGSREIFARILGEQNLEPHVFADMLEIGSIGAIKKLVAADVGISFLYREAVIDELAHGELAQIYYAKEKTMREFNFVFLKDSMFEEEYLDFYEFCKAHRAQKS